MERGVEIFAAINFIVMGLSHVVAPTAWKEFFTVLHSKGTAGSIMNCFLSIGMGAFIVAFHPGFDGVVPSLLTIYGWLSLLKGTVYLLFPHLGVKSIETPTKKDAKLFIIPGIVLTGLGVALLVYPRF
ncbi:MAG: hypothetical protein OEU54_06285 [Gemmatimonadota bacterium]|nr:hypothetical protein [Gemmatimonadota bacterium]